MSKRRFVLCMSALAAFALAACQTPEGETDNTASGALIGGALGAGTGALIGNSSHHRAGEGALIGGAVGALAGGVVGHQMDRQRSANQMRQSPPPPPPVVRVQQGQPLGVSDVKGMSQSGVGDDVIMSQIRASGTVYRLSAADIVDLKNSGVSEPVIDFMINTGNPNN